MMSKERDLLRRVVNSNWQIGTITVKLHEEIEKLLAQPDQEPFNPDWVSYRQGVADAKREPLSDDELPTNNPKINTYGERLAFHTGIRWAEKAHGITGVDDANR